MRTIAAAAVLLVTTAMFAQIPIGQVTAKASPVDLTVPGGKLHGTLLMLPNASAPPVVLLISGSGPTDRDGNSTMLPGKNDSLKQLAEALAARGIASVRYDKRGIGASGAAGPKEADLRFDTYIDDAAAWCQVLKSDRRFDRVIIAGHSEGSLIGMNAAKKCGAAGFVSMAGAGHPAGQLLRKQLGGKLPPDLAATSISILEDLERGKTTENVPAQLQSLYRPSVQPYMISWLKHDPAKDFAALTVPALVIQGTTDIQVSPDDAWMLRNANDGSKLLMVDGMNHVLKMVSNDQQKQAASYSDPSLSIAPDVVQGVVDLISWTTPPPKPVAKPAPAKPAAAKPKKK